MRQVVLEMWVFRRLELVVEDLSQYILVKTHPRLHILQNMLPPVAKLSYLREVIAIPSDTTQIVKAKPSSHRLVSLELVIHKETNLPSGRQFVLVEQGSGSPFQLSLEELVLIG